LNKSKFIFKSNFNAIKCLLNKLKNKNTTYFEKAK
jgi:hypothetical protein